MSDSPLDVTKAWFEALGALDADALVAASHDDFEWITLHRGTRRGHDELREWVARQGFGVAMHIEGARYFQRGDTVVVQTRTELRYVDGDELAGTDTGGVVVEVRRDRVARVTIRQDLPAALSAAGLSEADESQPE